MITILTSTKEKQYTEESVNSVDRLSELVDIITIDPNNICDFTIDKNQIKTELDWFDKQPPFIIPELELTSNNLLTLIFFRLGNHQMAFKYIEENTATFQHLLIATHLQFGYEVSTEMINFLKENSPHNLAITYNYGNIINRPSSHEIQSAFENSIKNEPLEETKLFSAKHYSNYLMDNGLLKDAENLILSIAEKTKTEKQKIAFNMLLVNCLKAQVKVPYSQEKLNEIITMQEECISYLLQNKLSINAGLLLIEASEIANLQTNYAKSKDLINKAILIFKEAEIEEFLGEATLQKATLLYAWSKDGSPQYYKPAINTYQNALKVFKRETHPRKFADIHHNLALIYSEIKVSENEKPIWIAFCASSFKDALKFYEKDKYPYQFAMISHNYATALMGFPEAKLHNNLDKSFDHFENALSIRTANKYPFERALTLLNQLELYWLIHNEDKEQEVITFDKMTKKAMEVANLVTDEKLIERANAHLEELDKLKLLIN